MAVGNDQGDVDKMEVDPWAAAFAALDETEEKNPEPASAEPEGEDGDAGSANGQEVPAQLEGGDGDEDEGSAGGPGDTSGADDAQAVSDAESLFSFSQEEIEEYKSSVTKQVEEQTIKDVAAAYIKQGARHVNGVLGADINDKDICKRDSDGVPRFYNPETGHEFTGDNPRKQAQEWVDSYNSELARAFNKTCADYAAKLMEKQAPSMAVIDFAPTYEKLDPMRKAMFESVIEGYEIHDRDGDLVGYSCDLNKALDAVNRQVKTIQARFANTATAQPSGPVLDTPSTAAQTNDEQVPQFKSIAEAMEYQQDQLLKKMREGK